MTDDCSTNADFFVIILIPDFHRDRDGVAVIVGATGGDDVGDEDGAVVVGTVVTIIGVGEGCCDF